MLVHPNNGRLHKPLEFIIDDNGCWIWQKQIMIKGYGRKWIDNKGVLAHVWYYKKFKGDYDSNLQLDHLCEVKSCVNPDHLEPVTNTENRRRRSTLTPDIVRHIRSSSDNSTSLSTRYGVTVQAISNIRRNKVWLGIQ